MTVVAGNANLPEALNIHSQVRRQATRLQRMRSPTRHRFTQRVLSDQRRLVRGRPLKITREQLLANLDELQEKNRLGILEVKTMDGRAVDLTSLEAAKPKVAPPLPHPPLDSVANDKPSGYIAPQYIEGASQMDPAAKRTAERLAAEKKEEAEKKPEPPADHITDPSSVARKAQPEEPEGQLEKVKVETPKPEEKSSPSRKKVARKKRVKRRSSE